MRCPHARSPGTGFSSAYHDRQYENDLTTTSMPASRSVETCITQHKIYEWCVVVANAIFMCRCSCCKKVRRRRLRRRFAVPLRNSRSQLNLVYVGVLPVCHKVDTLCSFGQGITAVLPFTRKRAASVKRHDAVLGQVFLLRWCLLFAFHCGQVRLL